ncbi:MAG: hypothetical protein MZU91_12940 [Desulfosudis oleivorans]|nr:hypothetical protein [Desulfosudis oleivorans]
MAPTGKTARDLTPEFVSSGRWENGYRDRFLDSVTAVQVGDPIAIKTTYVQKEDLPFDNQGKPVSCMRIKARGVVTGNPGDGRNLAVRWEPDFRATFVVYHYTYRRTIVAINEARFPEVVRWIFGGEAQALGMPAELSAVEEAEERDDRDDTELRDAYGPAPRNVIFYGPPGTGKTRVLLEQILPAYRRPGAGDGGGEAEPFGGRHGLVRGRRRSGPGAREADNQRSVIREHRFVQAKVRQSSSLSNLSARMWSVLQSHTIQSSTVICQVRQRDPRRASCLREERRGRLVAGSRLGEAGA